MYDVINAYMENGLKVILHRIPEAKTVSCGLWVNQGSKHENDENNGLSHLVEHLVINPQNANNYEYSELAYRAAAEGVIYNAATTKECTYFYYIGLKNTLDICLSCLAQIAINNRDFEHNFFENEKKVVLQEATSFYSSFQQIKERTSQAIWGNVGIGKVIMGNLRLIEKATQEQVQELLRVSYIPANATIVVVGNIDYSQTLEMIENKFGKWEDRRKIIKEEFVEELPSGYWNKGSGSNAVISIGFRAPSYQSEYRTATDMMVRILGQSGLQARIVQEVRMKRGLAYNVGGFSNFYKNRGTIGFMAVCDKNKTMEVADVIMNTFFKVLTTGFTEEEISREKKIMETSMLLSMENTTDHLRNVGKCSVMESNFYIENEVRRIRSVTKEDLDSIAKRILHENNMGLAVIGDCELDKLTEKVRFS